MANQTTATASRRIFFRSRGGSFSAILMADTGDLFQMYTANSLGQPGAPYYPDFTVASNQPTITLSLTSSQSLGTVTPDSVEWIVNGVTLTFDSTGKCNNKNGDGTNDARFFGRFQIDTTNLCQLKIIDNICNIAGGAGFVIEAKAVVDTDFVVAHMPVSITEKTDNDVTKVTIAPALNDTNNFTIPKQGGTCGIRARVFEDGGFREDSRTYYYKWEKLVGDSYVAFPGTSTLSTANGNKLTIHADDVDTYSNFRVTVYRDAAMSEELGQDTQGVLDASDPYDIVTSVESSKDGTTVDSDPSETLEDTYPDNAYIRYTPKLVRRGETTAVSNSVTWNAGSLVSASGLVLTNIKPTDNKYMITVGQMKALNGAGEYEFVFGCTIS